MKRRNGSLELCGLAETARLLGVSKAVLGARRRRRYRKGDALPRFPKPVAVLRCGPIWLRRDLVAYRQEAERLAGLSWWERRYGEPAPGSRGTGG